MPEYDDATLERIMREGLELHAGDAADGLREPMPPELWLPRGRPWLRRALVAAAVLTVIGVGGGVVTLIAHQDRSQGTIVSQVTGPDTSGWRTESYAGVSLQVPPSWGLGVNPVEQLGEAPALCSDDPGSPYVGRPVILSDMCVGWRSATGPYPTTDAVWFGSPLDVGSTVAAGRHAVTRALGGQHVTVFTDDTGLRPVFETSRLRRCRCVPTTEARCCGRGA